MSIFLLAEGWQGASLLLAIWLVLYLARLPFQKGIRAAVRFTRQPLQLMAHFFRAGAADMHKRNQALLRAEARVEAGLRVEREWTRLDEVVRRDVQGFPALQKVLLEQVAQWDDEFKRSAEPPQASAEWLKGVAAIMRLKPTSDPMVDQMQQGFKIAVEKAHQETLAQWQKAADVRHRALGRSQQMWRTVTGLLDRMDNRWARLGEHTVMMNSAVQQYRALSESDQARDTLLVSSTFVRLWVSGFVLLVAAGGAAMNFHLLESPLRSLGIGQGLQVGGHPAYAVVAWVLIAIEMVAGLALSDALDITHLFAPVALLARTTRRWLVGFAIGLLVALAGLEGALVFVQETAVQGVAIVHGLAMPPDLPVWKTGAEALLALVLPSVMAFVAIPLETFVHALRGAVGLVLETAVRSCAFVLRVGARSVTAFGETAVVFYDLVILPPLLLERVIHYAAGVVALRRSV